MASIDERVVSMAFENAKFEAGVAVTMATLAKLNASLQNIGSVNGFADIDKAAAKVTLEAPMSALDKLRARLGLVGSGAAEGFSEIDKAGNKVTLEAPSTAIDKLKSKLGLVGSGAADGFNEIEKASNKVTLTGVTNAIDGVVAKFSILQGAAAVALGSITAQAAQKGAAIGKSLSLGPITQGLQEYSTNLQSIQTILANTQFQGSDLEDVNAALKKLNTYSDQTIYNFGQMAKNIGTFTAAGVDLDTSVASIKGIANLAALSGSTAEQASTAMYQLSQAIASGRVSLQDWNSVVNAGMGGATFQRALASTAQAMGTVADGAVRIDKATGKATINGQSFRESITAKPGEQSWLTSEVLTNTLQQFTGDLSDADLAAQGFNKSQIEAIKATAKTAKAAATEVKTLPQVFDVAKETIGSGWAQTFQAIFGNFEEAKKTFTQLSQAINAVIGRASDARNKVLEDWKALGGRTDLIEGIKNIFEAIASFIKPLKDAFRQIFPAQTGRDLADLTAKFRDFAESLKLSPETADALRRTFAGFFAVLHIGWSIVKETAKVIFDLLGVVGKGSGGFLNFTGSIGDFLVALDKALTKGGALHGMFDGLASVIKVPLQLLGLLSSAIFNLFSGGDGQNAEKFGEGLARITETAGPLGKALEFLTDAWDKLVGVLDKVRDAVEPWLTDVATAFSDFGHIVADAFESINWDSAFGAIQTGLIGGLFLAIRKAIKSGIGVDLGGGMLENLSKTFKALTGNLQAMQKNIQAGTLLKIAGAIGVLAAAVTVLSMIEPEKLQRAMTAVAVGLGELVGALAILSKVAKGGAFLTLPLLSAGLVALATAVLILAGAVKIFATMNWEDLAKGLIGVGGALAIVGAAAKLIGPGIVPAALAMIPLALALNILALAVKQFGALDLATLAKGIGGIGVALGLIAVAMGLMPATMLITGAGLIAVGIGLNAVAAAVATFGNLELKTMVQGLLGIAGALIAIGISIGLIPPTIALQAAGLVILGVALTEIAGAIALMGKLKISTMIKGIAALGGVLVVLAIGLTAMAGTLPGSVALLAAAAAFAVLAPALALLGNLEWSTIIKGLVAMAAVLGVLAIAGALVAPPLAALGVALLPLGGFLIIAAGAALIFGKAMQLLGAEGAKAIGVVVLALTTFAAALPKIVISFLQGLVDIIDSVVKIAPQVLAALGVLLGQVIQFVLDQAVPLANAIGVLLQQFVKVVTDNAPTILAAGLSLLLTFLDGIANNIVKVVESASGVVIGFLKELSHQAPALVAGGLNVLVNFLKGIADHLPKVLESAAIVVVKFLTGVTSKLPDVIEKGAHLILKFLGEITKRVPDFVAAGIHLIASFIRGVGNKVGDLVDAAVFAIGKFIRAIANGALRLTNEGADALIKFLHGFATAVRTKGPEIRAAGWDVASALIEGLVDGLADLAHKAIEAVTGIFKKLPGAAKKVLGIDSPSKVFAEIGRFTMLGMTQGLDEGGDGAIRTVDTVANKVVRAAQNTLGAVPDMLDGILDMDPTITPVLDLSSVESEAKKLSDLTATTPLVATVSSDTASAVANETSASQTAAADAASAAPNIELNQYNTSPKALDEVEVYRQTKNQLAQVKSALGVTV